MRFAVFRLAFLAGLVFVPVARASSSDVASRTIAAASHSDEYDAATVLGTKHHRSGSARPISITPLVGGAAYLGRWNDNISNAISLGLVVEFPVADMVSIEAEGGYSRYKMQYLQLVGSAAGRPMTVPWSHDFDQYQLGANGKFYLTRGPIKPYLGLGVLALNYANMDHGPGVPDSSKYSQWMGAGQAIAGVEATITQGVALGVRTAWIVPVVGTPQADDRNAIARPGLEDSTAMTKSFVRFLGTAKIDL